MACKMLVFACVCICLTGLSGAEALSEDTDSASELSVGGGVDGLPLAFPVRAASGESCGDRGCACKHLDTAVAELCREGGVASAVCGAVQRAHTSSGCEQPKAPVAALPLDELGESQQPAKSKPSESAQLKLLMQEARELTVKHATEKAEVIMGHIPTNTCPSRVSFTLVV